MNKIINTLDLNKKYSMVRTLLTLLYPIMSTAIIYNLVVLGNDALIGFNNVDANYKFLYVMSFLLIGICIYLDVFICNRIKNHEETTSTINFMLSFIKILIVLFFCFNEYTFRFLNGREVILVFTSLQLASSLELILHKKSK